MHNLYNLTCEELEKLDRKAGMGDLSPAEFEKMSDLIETKKDMLKIGEMEEMSGSSFASRSNRGGSYEDGSYRSYAMGGSYAAGRGSQANRDRMGRYSSERGYSRDSDLMEEIEMLPEHKKNEIRRMIKEM